jgi:hypothetical protein
MKLKGIIDGVGDFVLKPDSVFLKKNQTKVVQVDLNFRSIFSFDFGEVIQELNNNGDSIYTNTAMDGLGIVIKNGEVFKKDFFINYTDEKGKCFGNFSGGSIKKDEFGNKEWEIPDKVFIYNIASEFIFYRKEKKILVANSYLTGNRLWQYTLPEMEIYYADVPITDIQISKIIGVYKRIVWIVLNTGFFIGLSVEDGSQKYFIKMPFNSPDEWLGKESFAQATSSVLSQGEGKIFGYSYKTYWEIDLGNPVETYMYYDLIDTSKRNHNIENTLVQPLCWQDDEIFIGQQEFSQQPSYIGLFSRKKKEITWTSYDMKEEGVFKGLRKIGMLDNRFYVLDATNTLHILER